MGYDRTRNNLTLDRPRLDGYRNSSLDGPKKRHSRAHCPDTHMCFDRRTRAYLAKVSSGQAINDTAVVHILQQYAPSAPAPGHGDKGHSSDHKGRGKRGAVCKKISASKVHQSLSSVANLDAESRATRQDDKKRARDGGGIRTVEAGPTSREASTNACNVRSVRLPANMSDVKVGFPKPKSERVDRAPTRNSYGGEGRAPDGNGPLLPSLNALPVGRRSAKDAKGKALKKDRKSDGERLRRFSSPKKRQNRRKESTFSATDRSSIVTEPRKVQLPILVR